MTLRLGAASNWSFPNGVVTRAYLNRGFGFWVGSRSLVALALAIAELPPFPSSMLASLLFMLIAAMLAWIDIRVRNERALLENLGVSQAMIVVLCALPAVAGEAVIAIVTRAL